MKPFRFDTSNPATALSLSEYCMKDREFNRKSGSVAVWLLRMFFVNYPLALLILRVTSTKDDKASTLLQRVVKGLECVYVYIKIFNQLLSCCAKDIVKVKAAS